MASKSTLTQRSLTTDDMAGKSAKKRFKAETRIEKARRWLKVGARYKGPLTNAYMKRYGVERWLAQKELMSLGYRDMVLIENYERQGQGRRLQRRYESSAERHAGP